MKEYIEGLMPIINESPFEDQPPVKEKLAKTSETDALGAR